MSPLLADERRILEDAEGVRLLVTVVGGSVPSRIRLWTSRRISGSRSSGDMRPRIVHLQRDKTMTVGHRVFTLLPYARRGAEALSVQREDLHGTSREGGGAGHETSRPMHVRADG